jgi:hypothetical protein
VTLADRALAALVAVFAPARAERLLARLATAEAGALLDRATRLAAGDRAARLGALAELVAEERRSAR